MACPPDLTRTSKPNHGGPVARRRTRSRERFPSPACPDTIAQRAPPLDEKLRDFLKVRGRPGQPCPRCGDKLRRASVHGYDAIFCPSCQPEDRKGAAVNARRTR
ncbi:zinc finger domain-containing protein [Sorangium sp. So ce118]